jgi:hypothetical protein
MNQAKAGMVFFCGLHPVALLICILPKYIPAIATDNLYLFYSVCSLHVSAPTGDLQVKHNNITMTLMGYQAKQLGGPPRPT